MPYRPGASRRGQDHDDVDAPPFGKEPDEGGDDSKGRINVEAPLGGPLREYINSSRIGHGSS